MPKFVSVMTNHSAITKTSVFHGGNKQQDVPVIQSKPVRCETSSFTPGLELEKGGTYGNHTNVSKSEFFLKQVFGEEYIRVSNSYKRLVLPVIPEKYIKVCTENDGQTEKVLARGGFGMVLEGMLFYPRGQMKKVILKENFDTEDLESLMDETRVSMYLERTGYVPVCFGLTCNLATGTFRIVQECFGNGVTLFNVLKNNIIPPSHHACLLDIACQLAEGLSRIHSMKILINDVKSDNVLVDLSNNRPTIRYCDFGISSYKKGIIYENSNNQNSPHIAPEHSGNSNIPTTYANDVYGLGRMIIHIYIKTEIKQLIPIALKCQDVKPRRRGTAAETFQDLRRVFLDYLSVRMLEAEITSETTVEQKVDTEGADEPSLSPTTSTTNSERFERSDTGAREIPPTHVDENHDVSCEDFGVIPVTKLEDIMYGEAEILPKEQNEMDTMEDTSGGDVTHHSSLSDQFAGFFSSSLWREIVPAVVNVIEVALFTSLKIEDFL